MSSSSDANRDRFERLQIAFEAIEDAEPRRRSQLIETVRAEQPDLFPELEELVASIGQQPQIGLEALAADAAELVQDRAAVQAEQMVGRYRLVEQIGVGGMGEVWLARQSEPVQRDVALKVLRWGLGAHEGRVARFEAEQQALATMDHPNIARVFDGGETRNGQPYFVMELVSDAVPVTEYCVDKQLSLEERLRLFVPVCEAVDHAHRKRIIHRDLKPSNVLVTEIDGRAVAKVIDFGIAKPLEEQLAGTTGNTVLGELVGTPEYMSPEQASLGAVDIDTRSDVFTLGVLLFELIVGELPLDAAALRALPLDELCRRIRQDDLPRASTQMRRTVARDTMALPEEAVNQVAVADRSPSRTPAKDAWRRVRGDLDRIVGKALAKDREQRYGSAGELADEIRRFLAHEPIRATPPSRSYQLRKFVRRNLMAVVGASLLLLGLTVGLLLALIGFDRARRAESEALATLASLRSSEQFLVDLFREASPEQNPGEDLSATELLRKGIEQLESLDDQPRVQGRLLWNLGQVQNIRGDYEEAERLLRRAVTQLSSGLDDGELISAKIRLSSVLRRRAKLLEAEQQAREALALVRGREWTDPLERADLEGRALSLLALSVGATGRFDEAEAAYRELLPVLEQTDAPDSNQLPIAYYNRATNLWRGGNTSAALETTRAALPLFASRFESNHPNLATLHHAIGTWSEEIGQLQCAISHEQRAISIYREVLPPTHSNLGDALNGLGIAQLASGEVEAARGTLQEADRIYIASQGEDSWRRMAAVAHLASCDVFQGAYAQGLAGYQRKIDTFRGLPPNADRERTLSGTLRLQAATLRLMAYAGFGESAELLERADAALEEAEQLLAGQPHANELASAVLIRATVAAQRGQADVAYDLLGEAERLADDIEALDNPRAFHLRAQVPALLGDEERALALLRAAIESPLVSAWLLQAPDLRSVWQLGGALDLKDDLSERLSSTKACVELPVNEER